MTTTDWSQMLPASRPYPDEPRPTAIEELRSNLRRLERGFRFEAQEKESVSTGVSALDDILPDQGLLRGTLSEWIAAEPGCGAASLAMQVAGQAQREGALIIVDGKRHFYAPAFEAAGVRLEDTILVRPDSRADELWAIEQSLKCRGIGAVLCQIDRLRTQEFRRLQLAAESGTAIGLLVRSAAARSQAGWADVRLLVSPKAARGGDKETGRQGDGETEGRPLFGVHSAFHPSQFSRRLEVRCVYAKGALADRTVELEICDETGKSRSIEMGSC